MAQLQMSGPLIPRLLKWTEMLGLAHTVSDSKQAGPFFSVSGPSLPAGSSLATDSLHQQLGDFPTDDIN